MKIELVIRRYLKVNKVKLQELEKATGISSSTLYRCFDNEDAWNLGNLNRVYRYLRVPKEEREY